jgi:hypothetical protein
MIKAGIPFILKSAIIFFFRRGIGIGIGIGIGTGTCTGIELQTLYLYFLFLGAFFSVPFFTFNGILYI